MARLLLGLLTLVLLMPLASASYALEVSTHNPMELDGRVEVEAKRTALRVDASRLTGTMQLDILSGSVTVWTWREVQAHSSDVLDPTVVPSDRAESVVHSLNASPLTLRYQHENAFYIARADDGFVGFEGPADRSGHSYVLTSERGNAGPRSVDVALPGSPPPVDWKWESGWLFVGSYGSGNDADSFSGFPLTQASETRSLMRGKLTVLLDGGNVSFVDAGGERHDLRLGRWSEESPGAVPTLSVRQQIHRWIVLEVDVASGEGPVGGNWGTAAPEMTWRVQEGARWKNATGTWRPEEGGAPRNFADRTVEAKGAFEILPRTHLPFEGDPLVALEYRARGIDELHVENIQVEASPAVNSAGAVAAAGASAGFTLWALARIALFLYTRLKRGELLEHPSRRAIYDAVRAHPGTPARELQRTTGLGWGAFNLHLRTLVQGKYLRLERVGRYLLAYPMETTVAGIPSRAARTVYAALPEDGSPVSLSMLRESVSMSRQLLDHHLKGLAARGLVRIEREATRGERVVAREREAYQ